MSDSNDLQDAVKRTLWLGNGQDQGRFYAILDTARDNIIYSRLAESDNQKVCLLIGDQARELATVAPYLVELDEDDPFTQWLLGQGWGKSWFIFVESEITFKKLRNHVRSFLRVSDEDGKILFFRYYDPRVLRVFLPTCDAEQLKSMFGPIDSFYCEGEGGDSIFQFSLRDSKLIQDETQVFEGSIG